MNNYRRLLLALGTILVLNSPNVRAQPLTKEWVVVLNDPRPARLKGWLRSGYSGDGHYKNALELKRSGQRLANKHGLAIRAEWFIESLGVYCLIAAIDGDQKVTLDRLRTEKAVRSVQASNGFKLLKTDVVQKIEPHGFELALLKPPELQLPESISGQGITIAIVDSAVDQFHPDIIDSITENIDLLDDSNKASTGEAHGTAIAGVIVADRESQLGVTGVASGANLKAYRGCWEIDSDSSAAKHAENCDTLSLARALDMVATDSNADILNLSLSGPKDELLDQLIAQIISQGTTVVVAYDPQRLASDRFPSIMSGIVTVRAESMNQDHPLVFAAPGQKIVAAPQKRARFMQGHSISTAYTSGVLALCSQVEQELGKPICTPSLFERLKNQNNNLHQLVTELKNQLDSASND